MSNWFRKYLMCSVSWWNRKKFSTKQNSVSFKNIQSQILNFGCLCCDQNSSGYSSDLCLSLASSAQQGHLRMMAFHNIRTSCHLLSFYVWSCSTLNINICRSMSSQSFTKCTINPHTNVRNSEKFSDIYSANALTVVRPRIFVAFKVTWLVRSFSITLVQIVYLLLSKRNCGWKTCVSFGATL